MTSLGVKLPGASADDRNRQSRPGIVLTVFAVVMSVVFISCEPTTDGGVEYVGIEEDGTLVATTFVHSMVSEPIESLASSDGGLTWTGVEELYWGGRGQSVETPRGTYLIGDQGIVLIGTDGESEMAYSTAHLRQDGNRWTQNVATFHLGRRDLTKEPLSIVYDERSDNLIAAMGIQGVVVGAPNGVWTRVAVGPYSPTDFSFSAKTGTLLSHPVFWALALGLSLTMCGIALLRLRHGRGGVILRLRVIALAVLVMFGVPFILTPLVEVAWDLILVLSLVFAPLVTIVTTRLGILIGFIPDEVGRPQRLRLGLFISWLLALGVLLHMFGGGSPPATTVSVLVFVLGASMVALYRRGAAQYPSHGSIRRHWPVVIAALAVMCLLVVLSVMLWLHLYVPLAVAKMLAVGLVAVDAFLLVVYINGKQDPAGGSVTLSH